MTNKALTIQQTGVSLSLKWLWRADALLTLIVSDVLIFATHSVIDEMGMSEGAVGYLRALGVLMTLHGLWQLWAARSGSISKFSFLAADLDTTVAGVACFAALLLGVEFNTAGSVITVVTGLGCFVLAGVWFMNSRKV